jgi:hypothetical protein
MRGQLPQEAVISSRDVFLAHVFSPNVAHRHISSAMVSFIMVRRRDGLASEYDKSMRQFGCGMAMFQPIAGGDMTPPCVGYRDSKGDWNRLAEITWPGEDGVGESPTPYKKLEKAPRKMEDFSITWNPPHESRRDTA